MAIHQDGGMLAEHSRYDDELARLQDKLGHTAIGYGAGAPAAAAALRDAEAAPAPVKAARAAYMANNGRAIGGKGDLVDAIAQGRGEARRRAGRASRRACARWTRRRRRR